MTNTPGMRTRYFTFSLLFSFMITTGKETLLKFGFGGFPLIARSCCCFFCDDASGTLHQAATFNMGARVRNVRFNSRTECYLPN